jgi:FtsZ-binding cell division protein ZapB
MAKTLTRPVDLEPIDRLEEKMKQLVALVARLRSEHAELVDANGRLTRELEALQVRVSDADDTNAELTSLRDEREVIRSRVSEMLQQIEALEL